MADSALFQLIVGVCRKQKQKMLLQPVMFDYPIWTRAQLQNLQKTNMRPMSTVFAAHVPEQRLKCVVWLEKHDCDSSARRAARISPVSCSTSVLYATKAFVGLRDAAWQVTGFLGPITRVASVRLHRLQETSPNPPRPHIASQTPVSHLAHQTEHHTRHNGLLQAVCSCSAGVCLCRLCQRAGRVLWHGGW